MVNQITRKHLPKEALKLAKISFVPQQKIPSLGGRVSAGPGLLDHLGRADSFSDENILRSVAATCQGPLPGVIEALALKVRGYGGGAGEEAVAWRRSVCFTELAKEFLEEGREGELLGEGREEELLEEREEVKKTVGDIMEEVIFRSVEKSEKNSVVRYSHFYHPLANSEDISRMTGTLERRGRSWRASRGCCREITAPVSTWRWISLMSIACTFPKILLASQFSRWRCCSSSWDISAARPGRRGVDKTELLRRGRQLGSLMVRS